MISASDPRRAQAEKLTWLPEHLREAWINAHAAESQKRITRAARVEFGDPMSIRAVRGDESDAELCDMAKHRAQALESQIEKTAEVITLDWLNAAVEKLDARPFACNGPHRLAGMLKRAMCPIWWRKQLRRACVRRHEGRSINAGVVGVRRAWYCTSETVRRRGLQVARNTAILEATELENEDGQCYTLAALVAVSPASKPIRRGELMTRIRGCEEWADAAGMVGVFTTNTAPSRFHSQGGSNPRHRGASPRDAQEWLCRAWARARAALQRAELGAFGFRVAEPHKDGCVHWHMLLWCKSEKLDQLTAILRAAWIGRSKWIHFAHGTTAPGPKLFSGLIQGVQHPAHCFEPGASEHRFKAKEMLNGGAAGYVAKYIAKNIDDAGSIGTEGHIDEGETLHAAPRDAQDDAFDTTPARRVESWAAAWGIRQFQAIGQPPVTVWRELRRINAATAAEGSERLQAACAAVHRTGEKRADWSGYMTAQGGAMRGRAYVLRLAVHDTETVGAYETTTTPKPYGVFDVARPGKHLISNRKKWKPRGTWTAADRAPKPTLRSDVLGTMPKAIDPPWTRFSNCTDQGERAGFGSLMKDILSRNGAMSLPKNKAGGPIHHNQEDPPPCHAPPH